MLPSAARASGAHGCWLRGDGRIMAAEGARAEDRAKALSEPAKSGGLARALALDWR